MVLFKLIVLLKRTYSWYRISVLPANMKKDSKISLIEHICLLVGQRIRIYTEQMSENIFTYKN